MAAITAELKLEIDQFRAALARAQSLSRNLKGPSGTQFFGGLVPAAQNAARLIQAPFLAVGRGMAYAIGGQVVNAMNQIPAQAKSALQQAMGQQSLEISFEALGKSSGAGARVFGALRDDALRTGVAIEDMADNVRKLMAQGIGEGDALKISDSMLDLGGAVGMTSHEIRLLGAALAQVKAKGVASMEELRQQIAERGVPIFEVLAEARKQTVGELQKDISLGKVNADEVLDLFKNMSGGFEKFKGGAGRMASTMAGGLGRIKQEWLDMLRMIGTDLMPILQPGVEWLLGEVQGLKGQIQDALAVVKGMMEDMSAGEFFSLAGDFLMLGFKQSINFLWAGLKATAAAAGKAFSSIFEAIWGALSSGDLWTGIGESLKGQLLQTLGLVQSMMASMLAGIGAALGDKFGAPFRTAAENLKKGADESGESAKESFTKAGALMTQAGVLFTAQIGKVPGAVERAFQEGFQVEDVTGAGPLAASLAGPVARMAALKEQAEIDRLSSGYTKERLESAARGRVQLEAEKMRKMAGAGSSGPGGFAGIGTRSFQKEINAMLGKESDEQVSILRKIERNTQPKKEQRPLAQRGLTFS